MKCTISPQSTPKSQPQLQHERFCTPVIDVTWSRDFKLSPEALWNLIANPGALSDRIPMLKGWQGNGPLFAGQTGTEIHSFLPGTSVLFSWRMLRYEPHQGWAMYSEPAEKTLFQLPHLTDYRISARDGITSALSIRFRVSCGGIFAVPGMGRPIQLMMHRTVRQLLLSLEE